MNPLLGPRLGTFRISMGQLAPALVSAGVLSAISLIRRGLHRDLPMGEAVLWGLTRAGLLTIGLLLIVWVVARLFPVQVYQYGMMGYTRFGRPLESMRWSEITGVARVQFLALWYWELRATGGMLTILVPCYLADAEEFEEVVLEAVGEDHVFARHLLRARRPGPVPQQAT